MIRGLAGLVFFFLASEELYQLPFQKGESHVLLQGYAGPYGHTGHAEFAYDFRMPVGTPVAAARAGKVVKVEQQFSDGTRRPGEENYVVIQHPDGTYGRYYHLTQNGVQVRVGDAIELGQIIGKSGNSGASAGPHLHFDVTKSCFDWGCQTVPIRFAGIEDQPLQMRKEYRREQ